MKLLLDTHIWIWSMAEPQRLSASAVAAIRQPGAECCVSVVSIWESSLLLERQRISVAGTFAAIIRQQEEAGMSRFIAVTKEIALAAADVPRELRDPADRLLLATARVEGMRLITADRQLQRFLPD
ncbi:MAG: type II toxin-antitoxin system VapC family toxin [Terriglobales bacterium]